MVDLITNNWPLIIAAVAGAVLVYGLAKKILKLALVVACVAAIVFGLVTQFLL